MKSLAEFKRKIQVGAKIKTVYHREVAGTDEKNNDTFKDKDLGIREITIAKSTQFAVGRTRKDGSSYDAYMSYPKASLCIFKNDTITICEMRPEFNDTKKGEVLTPILSYSFVN